jgi:hypothetical protein
MYKVKKYCGIILIRRDSQCSYSPFAYRPSPGQRPRLVFSSLLCLVRVSPAAPMCGPSSLHPSRWQVFRGLSPFSFPGGSVWGLVLWCWWLVYVECGLSIFKRCLISKCTDFWFVHCHSSWLLRPSYSEDHSQTVVDECLDFLCGVHSGSPGLYPVQ